VAFADRDDRSPVPAVLEKLNREKLNREFPKSGAAENEWTQTAAWRLMQYAHHTVPEISRDRREADPGPVTPIMDRPAAQGIRFTDAPSRSAVC